MHRTVCLALASTLIAASGSPAMAADCVTRLNAPSVVFFSIDQAEYASMSPEAQGELADALDDFQTYAQKAAPGLAAARLNHVASACNTISLGKRTVTRKDIDGACATIYMAPDKAPEILPGVMDDAEILTTAKAYFKKAAP